MGRFFRDVLLKCEEELAEVEWMIFMSFTKDMNITGLLAALTRDICSLHK